jgi:transglutaminase-like putative cysteine protease
VTDQLSFDEQISRTALYWLLFTQIALVLPHLDGLPLWLFAICGVCGGWRYLIYRQLLNFPATVSRSLIVVLGFVAISAEYLGKFSLDPAVALLVLAFFLKILETKVKRDVYVVICLGFFIAATRLLYSQTLYATVYALFCCMLLLVTLLSLHQTEATDYQSAFKRAAILMIKAVPLLVILFLFFPRVPPLWSVPLPGGQGATGVNDKLSPGSITRLAKSDITAFRVQFNGDTPPQSEQYWRGLVFDTFDGREWSESKARSIAEDARNIDRSRPSYVITMQASYQNWLFTLADSSTKNKEVVRRSNGTLASYKPLKSRSKYLVDRLTPSVYKPLSQRKFDRYTQLPETSNPQARQFGQQLRLEHSDNYQYAQAVLGHFNQNNYFYTLKTTILGKDSIDEFLFTTREGYCEHYATAFVFLMRAGNVPARAIGGYLGGEINPFEDYVRVRELDAHAWAEIWVEDMGWVRVDPTSAVAPERILDGVEEALRSRNEFDPSGLSGWSNSTGLLWINTARLWLDSINHEWTRVFLNYDKEKQSDWVKSWWGESSTEELLRVLIIAAISVLTLLFLWTAVINKWWALNTFTLLENYFCYLANKKGIEVLPSNTVTDVCKKLCSAYPIAFNHANAYRQWHEQFLYQEETKLGYYSATHNLFKLTTVLIFSRTNNKYKEVENV